MDKQLKQAPLECCPIAWQAQINPRLIAIQTETQQLTFLQLHQRINTINIQLIKLTMKKGDRLVCIAPNSVYLILLQLTCLRNGFIFCPINPRFSQQEIQQRLTILNSPFIWQNNDENGLVLNFKKILQQSPSQHPIHINPLDIISIIFTSGSSGFPKAVMHNFSNHYYSALGSQAVIPLNVGHKNLLSLPMFHISGYATVMRSLLAGATLQLFKKNIDVAYLQKNTTTHLSLVSSQLQKLLQNPNFQAFSLTIKHLLLGGSAFSSNMLNQTKARGFTYHLSYGSTEMASQVATSTNNESLQLLPYRQLKIVAGEILVAGETRFVGYFDANKESAFLTQEHYFLSSDLGQLSGKTLKVIGRKNRQFISGGENIQPEEVEKLLLTYPEVSQAYVLPIQDVNYGQRPIAFIKWHGEEQAEALRAFIKDRLITYKRPLHYFIMPAQQGLKLDPKQLAAIAFKRLLIN